MVDQPFQIRGAGSRLRTLMDGWTFSYEVLRGDVGVASVTTHNEKAKIFGAFQSTHRLHRTELVIGGDQRWEIRPCLPYEPADRTLLGKKTILGVSLGKKKYNGEDRMVELLDPEGQVVASVPTSPLSEVGYLHVGTDQYELHPGCRADEGMLGDRLRISGNWRRPGKASWLLTPLQPMTKGVSLPVAVLYWHILCGDHSVVDTTTD